MRYSKKRNSFNLKYTQAQFIEKAKKIHQNKYDYSEVEYTNLSKKIVIICPKHGYFTQMPVNHLKGSECPECVKEKKRENNAKAFLTVAKGIHNNKYDYSKVNYRTGGVPITIICPKHGEYKQLPRYHRAGHGCPMCVRNKKSSTEDFTQKARIVHGDIYDYSEVKYTINKKRVVIICPKHGKFRQTPNAHLTGSYCPQCAKEKLEAKIEEVKRAKQVTN